MKRACHWIAAGLVLLLGSEAWALNMNVGDIRVRRLGDYGFTVDNSVLSFDGGGTDELYQMFGYLGNNSGVVRVDANSFDTVTAINRVGNTANSEVTIDASGAAALGMNQNDLTIEYTFTMVDDPTAWDRDQFLWDVTINNLTGTDMNLVFYSYLDLDLDGASDFGDDQADANTTRIIVSDPDSGKLFNWKAAGGGADHFQVQAYSSVRDLLDAMTTAQDLSDAAAFFGPADFTAALQYDVVVPANGSFTLLSMPITIVPEPSVALLTLLGLLGLSAEGRRLRRN